MLSERENSGLFSIINEIFSDTFSLTSCYFTFDGVLLDLGLDYKDFLFNFWPDLKLFLSEILPYVIVSEEEFLH